MPSYNPQCDFCFACYKHGHVEEYCPKPMNNETPKKVKMSAAFRTPEDRERFIRLASDVSEVYSDIDSAQIWGIGKLFFDLGQGADLYNELIMAVGNKHEGETRHETLLRYIRESEKPSDGPATTEAE